MTSIPNPIDYPEEVFDKIREAFYEKFKEKIEKSAYHPLDLERIKKNNDWLRGFHKHGLADSNKTVALIDEVLEWRKKFDANSLLTPGKLPFDKGLMEEGGLFVRNKDKSGRPLLHFVAKKYKKGKYPFEHNCKYIAYFLEKNYHFNTAQPIVLLFDMYDAGIGAADLEMAKFLVYCLKSYYPGLIEYTIVYDIPMVFKAIWSVIKLLLPAEAVELVKFVDKKSVGQFIETSQLPTHMGGTDKFVFDKNDPDLYVSENLNVA